jgi:hypothetical protein
MGDTQSRRGNSGRRQDLQFRLARYLSAGQGCAVVIGDDQQILESTISRSLRSLDGVRVLSVSARENGLEGLVSLMHGSRSAQPSHSNLDSMLAEIAAARSGMLSMAVVVRDADLASPGALEQIRIAAEAFTSSTIPVRLILTGGIFLRTLLELPRLRGLATRVTARFELSN